MNITTYVNFQKARNLRKNWAWSALGRPRKTAVSSAFENNLYRAYLYLPLKAAKFDDVIFLLQRLVISENLTFYNSLTRSGGGQASQGDSDNEGNEDEC